MNIATKNPNRVADKQMGNIIVRNIPFSFEEDIDPIWNKGKHEFSHMANGASLTMPYLEPFLIKTAREALKLCDNDALKQEIHGFIGQEGQHYQNHRRYNEILKKSYPDLEKTEADMDADYKRFQTKNLRWRVAYSAGFETMTMGMTEWLIGKRSRLFKNADSAVTSLILWHMVEETEHKNSAFDLYQELYGDYWPRIWGLLCGSWHIAWSSRKGYKRMLQRDGKWNNIRSRLRVYSLVGQFLFNAAPAMLRSFSPFYHPSKVKDPKWVARWMDAYANLPADHIPLLNTADPEIPAQFVPQ